MAYVMNEAFCHFFAATDFAFIGIGQVAAQQSEREAMALKLVTSTLQLSFRPFNADGSEKLRTGHAFQMFQVTARGGGALVIRNISNG
jgi:hypothetical protein